MKILVGLSGGVDSAAAVLLLQKAGHEVAAATLVMHEGTDLAPAREVAEALGVPLYEIDCREEFKNTVVENFANEYVNARTPNPCIICNSNIKFKRLYDKAISLGFDKIATGHYARVVKADLGGYAIACGKDLRKDQTYMLYRLPQHILEALVFPLSDMTKDEVRALMREAGMEVASRKDSQEICFVPDGDYASFVEGMRGKSPEGDFLDAEGKVIGRHRGIIRYTIGQRKGLGVAAGARIFVTEIDPVANTVRLSYEDKLTYELTVSDIVYSGMAEGAHGEKNFLVKLRYAAKPVPCRVTFEDSSAHVWLSEGVRAVTPGQSAVFYENGAVMAGGFIDKPL